MSKMTDSIQMSFFELFMGKGVYPTFLYQNTEDGGGGFRKWLYI